MFIRKVNGEWLACIRADGKGRNKRVKNPVKTIFTIKQACNGSCGFISTASSRISVPKELVGTKVRIKIEIIKDEEVLCNKL